MLRILRRARAAHKAAVREGPGAGHRCGSPTNVRGTPAGVCARVRGLIADCLPPGPESLCYAFIRASIEYPDL